MMIAFNLISSFITSSPPSVPHSSWMSRNDIWWTFLTSKLFGYRSCQHPKKSNIHSMSMQTLEFDGWKFISPTWDWKVISNWLSSDFHFLCDVIEIHVEKWDIFSISIQKWYKKSCGRLWFEKPFKWQQKGFQFFELLFHIHIYMSHSNWQMKMFFIHMLRTWIPLVLSKTSFIWKCHSEYFRNFHFHWVYMLACLWKRRILKHQ